MHNVFQGTAEPNNTRKHDMQCTVTYYSHAQCSAFDFFKQHNINPRNAVK